MPDTQVCDRCDAQIVMDNWGGKRPMVFALEKDDGDPNEFEQHQRILCSACESDLLDWIDGDYTRENAVELPSRVASGETLRHVANDLEQLAGEMEDGLTVD